MVEIPMGPYEKIDIVNKLIKEIRETKNRFPELKVQHNPDRPGSILNAYREGDLSFEEAVAAINAIPKPQPVFQPGEYVAYVTRDQFGDEEVVAKVIGMAGDRCDLEVINSCVSISPKAEILTRVQVVWLDTHKPVEEKPTVSEELKEGWYRCNVRGSEWVLRYVKKGQAYLCDPKEFEVEAPKIPERVYRGPVKQYMQVKPIDLEQ